MIICSFLSLYLQQITSYNQDSQTYLSLHLAILKFLFHIDGVQTAELRAFLPFQLLDSLSQYGCIILLQCFDLFEKVLFKCNVTVVDMLTELVHSHCHAFNCVHDRNT